MGEKRGVYRVLVGKPEGKRSLGRPRRRWENNIKPLNSRTASKDVANSVSKFGGILLTPISNAAVAASVV
jgi:hypothetical protein